MRPSGRQVLSACDYLPFCHLKSIVKETIVFPPLSSAAVITTGKLPETDSEIFHVMLPWESIANPSGP